MAARDKTLNAVLGDVIRGEFTKYGLTLEVLSERTGIAYGTLRKKIIGTSPIFVTELLAITRAIDENVSPKAIMDEAQAIWERMSAAQSTNELQRKRHEKEEAARVMTPEELDQVKQHAATTDSELEQDEPATT